jgi:hypothetical protein
MSFEAPLPEEFLNTLEIIENDKWSRITYRYNK